MNNICAIVFIIALLTSCGSSRTATDTATALPATTSATLVSKGGTVINADPRLSDNDTWTLRYTTAKHVQYDKGQPLATLHFNPEAGTMSGCAGVNNFQANYKVAYPIRNGRNQYDHGTLTVSDIISTKVAGPDSYMTLERTFLSLLTKITAFRVTEYELELLQNDKVILRFEKQDP